MTPRIVAINEIDLYQCPIPTEALFAKDSSEWTIGDLHGSFIKLLHFLGLHGFIGITEEQYQTFLAIYLKDNNQITNSDLEKFDELVDSLSVIQQNALVRLIGDVLADRGSNDYFTLKLISKLVISNLKLEILFSNHDLEFIKCFESNFSSRGQEAVRMFFQSLRNLQDLIDKGLVIAEDIKNLVERFYKPVLKLVSYSLNETKDEIVVYSHAIIGFETIEALTNTLNVSYDDSTAEALANTINRINAAYSHIIVDNKVHLSYDNEAYQYANCKRIFDYKANPIVVVTQNRLSCYVTRPHEKNGYRIYYVHGHEPGAYSWGHIFNLDNFLGKMPFILKGFYHVFRFHPWPEPALEEGSELNVIPSPAPVRRTQYTVDELLGKFSQLLESDASPLVCPFAHLPSGFQQYWDIQTSRARLERGNISAEEYWFSVVDIEEKGRLFHDYAMNL